jgi:membrane protein YdbS with pleckstrin-like domain
MGGLDEVLGPDERLLFRTRLHWLPCAPSALAVSLLGVAGIAATLAFARGPVAGLFAREPWTASILAAGLLLVVALPLVVIRILVATHEFGVTDRRVVARMGWVATRTVDLNVTQVESLVIEQGALGRLFRYGDLKVVGTGGTAEVFRGVRDPIRFRQAVHAAADRGGARRGET